MSAGGEGGKVQTVRGHVESSLAIEAYLGRRIAGIHVKMSSYAADYDGQYSTGNDRALHYWNGSRIGRKRERCAALRSINFQFVFPCRCLIETPLSILEFDGWLVVECYFARARVRRKFQRS